VQAKSGQEAEVAEDLQLLADCGAEVAIGGMQLGKFRLQRIGVRQRKFLLSESVDGVEYVEFPAGFFDGKIGKRTNAR
jgi:hypothetical protein